jgi:3-hydroxypropanoate dehydrogenase
MTLEATLDPVTRDLVFDGHTTYTFDPTPLPEDTVEQLYELVKHAPTAFNAQPLRLIAVSPQAKERLLPLLSEGNRAKTASAPLTLIVAADLDFHDQIPRVLPNAPQVRDLFLDPQRRRDFAIRNTFLQFGYLILGIRALGYGAGPMTGIDAAGITEEFLAGTSREALAVVNVGHPGDDAHFPRNPRLAAHEVITRV